MRNSNLRYALAAMMIAALPSQAVAQPLFSPTGMLSWFLPMFRLHYLVAFDYIMLVIAVILGVVVAVFYYRAALLEAVKDMQKPARVKVRATGLGILVAALALMLAPDLPVGWLVLLGLAGAVMAASYGLSILVACALAIAVIIVVTLKVTHWIH